jgi:hypothetical protein
LSDVFLSDVAACSIRDGDERRSAASQETVTVLCALDRGQESARAVTGASPWSGVRCSRGAMWTKWRTSAGIGRLFRKAPPFREWGLASFLPSYFVSVSRVL